MRYDTLHYRYFIKANLTSDHICSQIQIRKMYKYPYISFIIISSRWIRGTHVIFKHSYTINCFYPNSQQEENTKEADKIHLGEDVTRFILNAKKIHAPTGARIFGALFWENLRGEHPPIIYRWT